MSSNTEFNIYPKRASDVLNCHVETALRFLKETNFFKQLQELRQQDANSVNLLPPLIMCDYEIDLILLYNCSPSLYEIFTQCPPNGHQIFQMAVDREIKNINCKINIKCTAPLSLENGNDALCIFKCYMLTSVTTSISKIHFLFYRCSDPKCTYPGQYVSFQEVQKDQGKTCGVCSKSMIEDLQGRKQTQQVLARFLSLKGLKPKPGVISRSIKCAVRENFQNGLELGAIFNVWGYHTSNYFEVLGLAKIDPYEMPHDQYFFPSKVNTMLSIIQSEYPNNPWALVRYLSSQIGFHDPEVESLISIKMALILSLATTTSKTPASILCIGSDSVPINNLMDYASALAIKGIDVHVPLSGSITCDELDDHIWINSGCLIIANSGVCMIQDWDQLKPIEKKEILSVMGEEIVKINTRNLHGSTPVSLSLPLKTAIWTFLYNQDQKQNVVLKNLVDIFGIPFVAPNADITVDSYIRSITSLEANENTLSVPELSEYIRVVSAKNVEVTEEAMELIKKYFMANRRVRGDHFPLCCIKTLTTLSEGHAKLSLRSNVTYDDVVAVIYLYEESLFYLWGSSISTPPLFKVISFHTISDQMKIFKEWLETYLLSII